MNRNILMTALVVMVIVTLLWLVLKPESEITYPPYMSGSAHLVYDEAHENVWGIWDTGYYGYSEFASAMVTRGVPVSCVSRPADEVLSDAGTWSFEKTILVLSVTRYQRYSDEEIKAIVNFVDNGGLLLVIGEHENMFDSSDFQNAVLGRFGLKLNDDFVGETVDPEKLHMEHVSILNQQAGSEPFGLDTVKHMLSASIGFTGNGEPEVLLEGERNGEKLPIATGVRRGRGSVLVLGDSEMLWNGDGNIGIHAGDNMEFMISCVEWLLQAHLDAAGSEPPEKPAAEMVGKGGDKPFIWLPRDLSGVHIDESPSGLKKFADGIKKAGYRVVEDEPAGGAKESVVIITVPLKQLPADVFKKNRVIVSAESFMALQKYTVWGKRLLSMGARPRRPVYGALAAEYGVILQPCFLTDGGLDGSYLECSIPFFGRELALHRAGSLLVETGKNPGNAFMQRVMLPRTVWGETSHPGIVVKNDGRPLYQSSDVETPILIYANEKVLVIADSDIIGNQYAGTEGFGAVTGLVVDWIGN